MAVYVDDMHRLPLGRLGRMRMSHMVGTTEAELHAMAERIGVARRWYQGDHYDIALSKRALAVQHGAREITARQCAAMMAVFRRQGVLPVPEVIEARWDAMRLARAAPGAP